MSQANTYTCYACINTSMYVCMHIFVATMPWQRCIALHTTTCMALQTFTHIHLSPTSCKKDHGDGDGQG